MQTLLLALLLLVTNPAQARYYGSGGGHDYYTLNYVTVHPTEELVCYNGAAECLEVGQDGINHFVDLMYVERKIKEDYFVYYCMLFFSFWAGAIVIVMNYREVGKI